MWRHKIPTERQHWHWCWSLSRRSPRLCQWLSERPPSVSRSTSQHSTTTQATYTETHTHTHTTSDATSAILWPAAHWPARATARAWRARNSQPASSCTDAAWPGACVSLALVRLNCLRLHLNGFVLAAKSRPQQRSSSSLMMMMKQQQQQQQNKPTKR